MEEKTTKKRYELVTVYRPPESRICQVCKHGDAFLPDAETEEYSYVCFKCCKENDGKFCPEFTTVYTPEELERLKGFRI